VPLPLFLSDTEGQDDKTAMDLFIEYNFLAQITLRTLINRARTSLNEYEKTSQMCHDEDVSYDNIASELQQQLWRWRNHLPTALSWVDEETSDVSGTQPKRLTNEDMEIEDNFMTSSMPDFKFFLNAALQTRYKYAEYTIWKPYIKWVLHPSGSYNERKVENCRQALKACCLWPLTLGPFQSYKRLLPHLYEYTHALFEILILVQVCSCSPTTGPLLLSVLESHELQLSKKLYLRWIRDMKIIHPVAKWSWQLLKIICKEHSLVQEETSGLSQMLQVEDEEVPR